MQSMAAEPVVAFKDLSLSEPVLKSLADVGYEIPTPIQAQTIPLVLAGRDVLGQAQTGTGKTAAFALPLLSRIDIKRREVQVLVLTPTRELAIQVAEAFQRYAARLKDFHVLPIYGGQAYDGQLRSLRRGVHVVVGTPGRVMDHMRRKTLRLDKLSCLVLDEADEMLRMGFIDDVDWILQQTPPERQTALFSATMPDPIRRIASRHLRDPEHIKIETQTTIADTISQYHWMVSGMKHKTDALTRILEAEPFDGVLIFVRTRTMTTELSEKLEARGYASAALSGEMAQHKREKTVDQLKKGKLDILVATDVAARGLDIDRISHVINFDIPHDPESYIHRIGRTGRAGRSGKTILFVAPRERRLLFAIQRATEQKIPLFELPSPKTINDQRIARFTQSVTEVLATEDLGVFRMVLEQYQQEQNVPALEIAAALAKLVQGDEPLLLAGDVDHSQRHAPGARPERHRPEREPSDRKPAEYKGPDSPANRARPDSSRAAAPPALRKGDRPKPARPRPAPTTTDPATTESVATPTAEPAPQGREERPAFASAGKPASGQRGPGEPGPGMERFRAEVGRTHGMKPGNLVGAIINEAVLDPSYIGHIEIYDDYSTVDLPEGMGRELLNAMKKVRVCGQRLRLAREGSEKKFKGKGKGGKHSTKSGKPHRKNKPSRHRKGNKPSR